MSTIEHRIGDIVVLFRGALGRNPERAAIESFLHLLEHGSTFHDIAHAIAGSQEFRLRHGEADVCTPEFLRFLHQGALGRAPRAEEATRLRRAASRGEALETVAGSSEARKRVDALDLLYPEGVPLGDDLAYRMWLRRYGLLTPRTRRAISRVIDRRMPQRPGFDLMMLAGHDRVDLLAETVASLEAQLYPEWSLHVVLDDAAPPRVAKAVETIAQRVPGISVHRVEAALSMGERWQWALDRCRAAFCAFLYPGDHLAPDALFRFASEIVAQPETDLLYCDEDRLDSDGERADPRFKPAWSRDMLYAGDVVGQLAVFRRERAMRVGGVRNDGGEFARYDLLLRVCEGLPSGAVRHVARILYHRGRGPGREIGFPQMRATPHHPAMLKTIERHLAEARGDVILDSVYMGGAVWPRILYPLPEPVPLVSIVIPVRDHADMLETCVRGILTATDYERIEVLIVDNDSRRVDTRETLRRLMRDPRVRVLDSPGPFNWSALNNAAAARCGGALLLFMNNDIEIIRPDWLRELVCQIAQPDVGIAGARLFYVDGSIQHAGIAMTPTGARHVLRSARADESGYMGQIVLARDVTAVTGACMMVRAEVFAALGGFEESFPLTCNDVEFCLRARRAGYRVVWTPHSMLTHVDGGTRGRDVTAEQIVQTCLDNGRLLDYWDEPDGVDPYVNANLKVGDHHLFLAPRRVPAHAGRRVAATEPA